MESSRNDFLIHTNVLTTITKSSFYCYFIIILNGYMVDWKKLNETSLPGKEDFYSHLNM